MILGSKNVNNEILWFVNGIEVYSFYSVFMCEDKKNRTLCLFLLPIQKLYCFNRNSFIMLHVIHILHILTIYCKYFSFLNFLIYQYREAYNLATQYDNCIGTVCSSICFVKKNTTN